MTTPDHFAGSAEELSASPWVRLAVWLRVKRDEARQRRAERRHQALLRSLGPTVLEDLGYEMQPQVSVGVWLTQQHPLVIAVQQFERRG